MEKLAKRLDDSIFNSFKISQDNLALCRIAYALFNLFFLFHFNFSWIAEYPDAFYHAKPGLTFFFEEFPPVWVLNFFNIALCVLHFFLLFGLYTRTVSLLTTLMFIVAFSFVFAFGNTYHVILWLLFPAVMSFSNWGAALSLDTLKSGGKEVESWPITLMSVLIGFAFFTSGLAKLLGGWLKTENSASWQYFHIVRNKSGRDLYLSDYISTVHDPFFWEVLDWLVVGFEIGFLVAVFSVKIFRFFVCMAVLFHFSNVLILNISFSIHLVIFMVFMAWNAPMLINSKALIFIKEKMGKFIGYHNLWAIFGWIGLYLGVFFSYGDHSRVDGLVPVEYTVYGLGLYGCIMYFYVKLTNRT